MCTRLAKRLSNLFAPEEVLPPFSYEDPSFGRPLPSTPRSGAKKSLADLAPISVHDLAYGLSTFLLRKPSARP